MLPVINGNLIVYLCNQIKNMILQYTYIEDEEYIERGISFGLKGYIVLVNMPFDTTFDSVEDFHLQYDLNETNT